MNDNATDRVERVLVAVNAAMRDDDALAAAVEFAAVFGMPLTALFVEDVNLFRLSELPFAKELDCYSGVIRPLDPARVGRAFESEVHRLSKRLQEESKRRKISVSLEVVRGHYASTAVQMARRRDIVFVDDVVRRSFVTATGTPRASSMRDRQGVWQKPVWVLYDGTKRGRRALSLAASLGRAYDLDVVVMVAESVQEKDLDKQLKKSLLDRRHKCDVVWLGGDKSLVAAARKRGCAALVLPRDKRELRTSDLVGAVAPCPRILV